MLKHAGRRGSAVALAYERQLDAGRFTYKLDVEAFNCKIDMVIYDRVSSELFAVEFKNRGWKKTLERTRCLKYHFHSIFMCVPKIKDQKKRDRVIALCEMNDIGLIFCEKSRKAKGYVFEEVRHPSLCAETLSKMIRDQMYSFACELI